MLGFTIDSINLFKKWNTLENFNFEEFGKKIKAKPMKKRGWKRGYYKKFIIVFNPNYGIYVMGSISNYFIGYNDIMPYKNLIIAIDILSTELGLDLHSARLYRLDLALNIQTKKSISRYTHFLFLDLPRFKRLEQDDGVRFESNKIKIAIYNKTLEVLQKRGMIIENNILRIEFRITKSIADILEIKEMEISDIYDTTVYEKLLRKFEEYYFKIKKQYINSDLANLQEITPKILKQALNNNAIIEKFGSQKEAYRAIEHWQKEGKIKDANIKSRLRKIVSDYSKNEGITQPHPLVLELDKKVSAEIEKAIKSIN
ncbi:hypothetical protein [Flavobacterium columnare]|uniref:Uncharacterized protein n=1 Tax=Flavobacterium columnare TaxID=996 RepID=A0AA94JQY7_9FLAO|nr:hypothetical protein [Flavobacterium columnare]MCH4830606.1 hypothetical protein [Flavobacterium columnare]MCH4833457.1 hypothetical protein [Flavobacterium columnare]